MSSETPDQPARAPWAPVGGNATNPAQASAPLTPQPIDPDDTDADIVRPVAAPPSAETFPAVGGSGTPTTSYSIGAEPGPDDDEPAPITDPFQALGQSAVTNAAFSAGGAHTPMGGVPLPSGTFTPTAPDPVLIDRDEPTFVPNFATREPQPPIAEPKVSFSSVTPVGKPGSDVPEPPHHASAPHHSSPWWLSVAALVIYGVLVMAGLGYAAYALMIAPQPVTLAAGVLIAGPPDNGIDPVSLDDPTAFLASAPLRTPTHSLTAVQTYQLGDLDSLPGRFAEVHDLTYFDGETTFVVRAYQHFNVADAEATFAVVTDGATELSPITSFGDRVGDKAELMTDAGTVIIWRNTTAVFELTGPEAGLEEFFLLFGW